jgi:hypothetical protein
LELIGNRIRWKNFTINFFIEDAGDVACGVEFDEENRFRFDLDVGLIANGLSVYCYRPSERVTLYGASSPASSQDQSPVGCVGTG